MNKAKLKKVEERLNKIATLNGGRITPVAVVNDAKDPKSPLHDRFEWDDKKAGHQYRLEQARTLIRTVKVHASITSRVVAAPHYVRDPNVGEAQGYVALTTAKQEAGLAREVMRDEMGRVLAACERARAIAGELGMDDDVEKLIEMIQSIMGRSEVAQAA